jgi:hypothetical protein
MPYYLNPSNVGVALVSSLGDGNTVRIKWHRAFPTTKSNLIAYNIYINTIQPDFEIRFFDKSPAFVSVDGKLTVDIIDLTPGQMYRFAVRPVECDAATFEVLKSMPVAFNNLRVYPESPLREDISAASNIVPVVSVEDFPASGIVRAGAELIQYSSLDTLNNNLVLTNVALQRGFNGTEATIHTVDGYDGYAIWDPTILFFPVDSEDQNTVVFATQDRFDVDHYAFTTADGYRQTAKDIVNTDLSVSDQVNEGFPSYDYAGWNRTDPVALLNGECVGSYFGGQYYCADGYNGVGQQIRGLSVDDVNTMRQEELLSMIGEPVCLMKRQWTGIRCFCVLATSEHPDARCKKCYGTGFVVGYQQYFDPRNSDGRIRIRFDSWVDDLPLVDSGLDPEATKPSAWTLVLPAIKKRDFIVRFDSEGNEEFRYEIVNVTRNILFNQQFGAQKLSLQRIRKTDIIYQCPVFRDTSTMPSIMQTGISSSLGVPPHSHTVEINEKHPSTWNQITGISAGHSHTLRWSPDSGLLLVSEELGHSHTFI